MDITDQFQQVGILLAQDRFVTILEQDPMPTVSSVVGHGVTGQEPAHHVCHGNHSRPDQKVDMLCEALDYVKLTSCRL